MMNIFSKTGRITLLQSIYIGLEVVSILIFLIILLFGISEFILTVFHFFDRSHKDTFLEFPPFVKGLLSSLEIFFLAPIVLLIISSFKRIIIKMYPLNVKIHPTESLDMINEMDAKKTFISSLIGVTSTFILGQLIESLTTGSAAKEFQASKDFYFILLLSIAFLIIQIVLYSILSSHHSDEKNKH